MFFSYWVIVIGLEGGFCRSFPCTYHWFLPWSPKAPRPALGQTRSVKTFPFWYENKRYTPTISVLMAFCTLPLKYILDTLTSAEGNIYLHAKQSTPTSFLHCPVEWWSELTNLGYLLYHETFAHNDRYDLSLSLWQYNIAGTRQCQYWQYTYKFPKWQEDLLRSVAHQHGRSQISLEHTNHDLHHVPV